MTAGYLGHDGRPYVVGREGGACETLTDFFLLANYKIYLGLQRMTNYQRLRMKYWTAR